MRIVAIYDNREATFDRYTIITDQNDGNGMAMALGLSDNPDDSNGFSQWGSVKISGYVRLGKKAAFEDLPAHIQAHIAKRVFNEKDN